MTNTEIALLAHRAGFGEKTENQIRIEEFAKLKHFAEMVLAKRTWVGLTDEAIDAIEKSHWDGRPDLWGLRTFIRKIEQKLKEKNT